MNQIDKIEWLDDDEKSRKRYNNVFDQIKLSNIPQIWDYGTIKKATEGSDVIRGIIKDGRKDVGTLQILVKKKYGIPIAARINRGPLLLEPYDTAYNHILALKRARMKITRPIPVVCAPNIEYTPENIELLTEYRWKQWNPYGYETGVIDLNDSIDDIRKGFDSKWRNQLKSSEKFQLEINEGFSRFGEIIDIYEQSQKEKEYDGIPRSVLLSLKALKESPLKVFYITNADDDIIAFDIFYSTENFGLYFVGWNDDEGRKMYVNNLLLFHAAEYFKNLGGRWLDLGGIDYIDTEENARFKDGMRPKHIRLAGEFIKF